MAPGLPVKKPKAKKCKECDSEFVPQKIGQVACSVNCAILYSRKIEIKKRKSAARKEKIEYRRTKLSYQLKLTQTEFNKFIRVLDAGKPCISCGKYRCGATWDCGHYLTVGAFPELRFDPRNAYIQGSSCNRGVERYARNREGVRKGFEQGILERYGQKMLDFLNGPHKPKNYSVDELIELRKMFSDERKFIIEHGHPTRDWRRLPA